MPSDPADVDRAVDQVFSDPALRRGLDASHMSVDDVIRLLELYVAQAFGALAEAFAALYASSPLLYYGLVVTLLGILVLLLWHIGHTLARAFQGVGGGEDEEPSGAAADGRERRYRDLVAEAASQADQGQPREAIRTQLLALLALLAEERVLRVARSWTPREVLGRLVGVAAGADGQLTLGDFRRAVESASYGSGAVTQEDYQACARVLEQVAGQVRRLRRAAPALAS